MQAATTLTNEAALNLRICNEIRAARLRLGLSQRQVEAALGMAEATFSRYETGQRTISAAMLCRIAAVLRTPPSALLPPIELS